MAYHQVLKYLNSLTDFEKNTNYHYKKRVKLQRIKGFLSLLENPQHYLKVIHIAGSKGKGSTSAFIAYILREAGFTAGLYTSPHLKDFRERIRILRPFAGSRNRKAGDFEGMISVREVTSLVNQLKSQIKKYNRVSKYGPLTFFEVYTAIALLYFKRKNVDFVVLETGMGGRLDATNAVDSLVQVITPISYEHTQKLGKTLDKIAAEKAGIIKDGKTVICAPQKREVLKVIRNKCKDAKAKLYIVGRDIKYSRLKTGLIGRHQLINAALAKGAVERLADFGVKINPLSIRRGIKNTVWPGRCEIIRKKPLIILDGAQNLASAQAIKKAIIENFKYNRIILVLGVSADKDIKGMAKTFNSLGDEIILTRAQTPRAAPGEKLAGYFKRKLYLTGSVKEAKLLSAGLAGENDLILVTGSLFVVGEFRDA